MNAELLALVAALTKIRDSTFRDAASLRAIADAELNKYRAGDYASVAQGQGFVMVPRDAAAVLWDELGRHGYLMGSGPLSAAHPDDQNAMRGIIATLFARHEYWGAGEQDCPKEIKAGNGELHTLMCKVCGQKKPKSQHCNPDADEDAYVIDMLARLLAEIAIALKGPQPLLTRWSYHDLPALVRELVARDNPPESGGQGEWAEAVRVACLDGVDEALRDFATDPTGDNGTTVVREVMRAMKAHPPAQASGAVPEAVQAKNPAGGVIAHGDWCIKFGTHVRVTNAEFARGWNEARALAQGGGNER